MSYIKREDVEKMLDSAQIISDGEWNGYCTEDINISSIPSAKVREDVRGQWIDAGDFIQCSVCKCTTLKRCHCVYGELVFISAGLYCSHCGADMRGGAK